MLSYANQKDFELLQDHSGHGLTVIGYGDNEMVIECEDCFERLLTVYKTKPE